jgi:hypothetical protein
MFSSSQRRVTSTSLQERKTIKIYVRNRLRKILQCAPTHASTHFTKIVWPSLSTALRSTQTSARVAERRSARIGRDVECSDRRRERRRVVDKGTNRYNRGPAWLLGAVYKGRTSKDIYLSRATSLGERARISDQSMLPAHVSFALRLEAKDVVRIAYMGLRRTKRHMCTRFQLALH